MECIRTFFRRRYQYESVLYPKFSRTLKEGPSGEEFRLDVVVAASGFGNKEMKTLEKVSQYTTLFVDPYMNFFSYYFKVYGHHQDC